MPDRTALSIQRRRGFTLIELLIVVAIIAILAAIAIPNFLEAQTRAKLSRVKSDMRTLATGIESYIVDYNYPPYREYENKETGTFQCYGGWASSLRRMTTPVAYLTSLPGDVFQPKDFRPTPIYYSCGSSNNESHYVDDGSTIGYDYTNVYNQTFDFKRQDWVDNWNQRYGEGAIWRVCSAGADLAHTEGGLFYGFELPYDPTNGTISYGNICRWGGGTDE